MIHEVRVKMGKSATLAEVAERAGVAVITVSRALSGKSYVAPATRKKILAAAKELDYTPDVLAQTMRGGNSNLIGVFLAGFRSILSHDLLVGIDQQANRLGYDLMVLNAANFELGRTAGVDTTLKLCDGVIWLLPNSTYKLMDKLERGSVPSVLVNFSARPVNMPVVIGANHAGSYTLVQHLIEQGHRNIAFIGGTPFSGQSMERQRGYEDALRHAGIAVRPDYIASGNFIFASGLEATRQLLALPEPPTAIFCANDDMAFGALQAAVELGLKVPDDVSIAGFDDVPSAAAVTPRLTTVRQPLEDIGIRAVDELVAMIGGRPAGPSKIELPTQLIERDSTGPAPRGNKRR